MTLEKKFRIMIPIISIIFGFILLLSAVIVLLPTFAYSATPTLMGLILLYIGTTVFLFGVIFMIVDALLYKKRQKKKVSKF